MAFPKEPDENNGSTIGGTIGGTINEILVGLSERQKEVVNLIIQNNKISITDLSEKLNINRSAAQEHIELLKEKGIIKRIGGTRGYWKILWEEEKS